MPIPFADELADAIAEDDARPYPLEPDQPPGWAVEEAQFWLDDNAPWETVAALAWIHVSHEDD